MQKIALITGATSGIGEATARLLSINGFNLIICGRRKDRLNSLKNELSQHTKTISLSFDVAKKSEVLAAIRSLPDDFKMIDVLINNAGNAHGLSSIEEGDLDDWDAMIDINVKGLLYVSREIIPGMAARNQGHIINIGSIAGKEVYPNGNVYCASKHAVDAISKAMRYDLNKYGIRVGEINPGLVETEFSLVRFKGDRERAKKVYEGYQALKPADIADIILFMVNRPPHVNIADITVFPTAQAGPSVVKKSN
jgi:NADP-dependent 3-hydroxy acid dehydrogenase YdfG